MYEFSDQGLEIATWKYLSLKALQPLLHVVAIDIWKFWLFMDFLGNKMKVCSCYIQFVSKHRLYHRKWDLDYNSPKR